MLPAITDLITIAGNVSASLSPNHLLTPLLADIISRIKQIIKKSRVDINAFFRRLLFFIIIKV